MAFMIHKRVMPPAVRWSSQFTLKSIRSPEAARLEVNLTPPPPPPPESSSSHATTTASTATNHTVDPIAIFNNHANMVKRGGVSVRVADFGFDDETYSHAFYKEHEIDGNSYIKVATGEQFVVIIEISPDFDFMGAPEVQIRCKIDCEDTMWSLSAAELARLRAQHNMRRINYFDTERFIGGRWMRCALSFGELIVNERDYWSPQEVRSHSVTLGRIVVMITRGATEEWGPVMVEPREATRDWVCTARAVVENHHIIHALKALPFEETLQPWQDWHFEPADGVAGRPMKLEIRYRSQEALELLGVAPNNVKDEPEDRKDPTIKNERAPVMPKLEVEAVVKIEDGEVDEQRPPIKSEASESRRKKPSAKKPSSKKPSSKVIKQEPEQDAADSGNKRKRKAASESTSTSKKVKQETLEFEQEGPFSRTRSKARGKAPVSSAVTVSKAATATKTVSGQHDDDEDDDDEVEFISSQPARRIVARIEID